jgi:membrane peptidoglycan carboxypeptidase
LPGPYWQDEGDAGYGSGWRTAPSSPQRADSPWDDGSAGFWRDDRSGSRDDRSSSRDGRSSRRAADRAADRGAARDDSSWPGMLAGRSRRGSRGAQPRGAQPRADQGSGGDGERSGRFSQTADDLRSRLGVRGPAGGRGDGSRAAGSRAAGSRGAGSRGAGSRGAGSRDGGAGGRGGAELSDAGLYATGPFGAGSNGAGSNGAGSNGAGPNGHRPDDDFWGEPDERRSARSNGARPRLGAEGSRTAAIRARVSRDGAGTARGLRRAGGAAAAYPGDYGDYGDGLPNGPGGGTALREQPDDFWTERDRTGSGVRPRVGERPGGRRGGGRGGQGGGRGGGGRRFDGPDPRSRGERFKDWLLYGSWWRHWSLKKAIAVLGIGAALCFLLFVGAFFIIYNMTPIPNATAFANWQSSTVLYSNGKPLGTFDHTVNGQIIDRQLLSPSQIPTVMTQAITAAEDRQFYTEGGVSLTGLLRSAYEDVFGNGGLQGGSTITMQYAKNYYSGVNTGQNMSTKLKEIFIATKLGRERSKPWVMTNYLNTVPFGPTTYGVGAAAEGYFGVNLTKSTAKLTIAQAAMLAAMPNSPGFFNPDPQAGAGYTALVARWKYVLANMVRDGNITQAQANAQVFPKLTPPPSGNGWTGYTGYLMSMVEQQLEAPVADGGWGLTEQQIDTGGYKITTTFNLAKVNALARSVNQEKAAMRATGLPFRLYDRIGAVLENAKTGAIVAIYGGPGFGSKHCNATSCQYNTAEIAEPVGSSFKPYVLAAAVKEGMNVFTSRLNGYSPIWIPTNSPNLTQTELTLSPTKVPAGLAPGAPGGYSTNGVYYFKFDESQENSGRPLPVNVAAAISSDPAFEDLAHRDGIDAVINMAAAFGVGQNAFVQPCSVAGSDQGNPAVTIQDCNDLTGAINGLRTNFSPTKFSKRAKLNGTPGSPAIALGENPLTPIEQATTFATLANDGVYNTPHVIQTLQKGTAIVPNHYVRQPVLTPQQAADVDYALSFDNNMAGGTAEANVSFRRGGVIAKTGTLGTGANSSEAWFIGATPNQYAMSVALFTNNPGTQVLNNLPSINGMPGSQGGGWPATIWNNFMTAEFSNTPAAPMFTPQNGFPFVTWIQAKAKRTGPPACKMGQFTGCKCQKNNPFCQNPNPTPSCQQVQFGQPCGGTSPSPSPSCGFGQPCTSPSPTASPTCTPSFGQPCNARTAAATTRSSTTADLTLAVLLQPAEEATTAAARMVLLL